MITLHQRDDFYVNKTKIFYRQKSVVTDKRTAFN